jgi:DNA polymerase III alpha subunit (gram-positive type)
VGEPLYLKPRHSDRVPFEQLEAGAASSAAPDTPLDGANFVALDVETTGNRPFLVLEIGAERFDLERPLAFFDTLVETRAPINPYARRRHGITRDMLAGAPGFGAARRAFLEFARGAVLVEHSHDAFDTWLLGRGLRAPLPNPVVDTTALARLVLELPAGQTPGLIRLVSELDLEFEPQHAALGDARATAGVFRALVKLGRERLGWRRLGDLLAVLPRPEVDRSEMESRSSIRRGSSAGPAADARAPTGRRRSAGPASRPGGTSRAPSVQPGRSRRRRRSGSS